MSAITLEQMLGARERRAGIQQRMLAEASLSGSAPGAAEGSAAGGGGSPACLVCLTLNIAGEVKRTPMTRMLFERGLEEFGKLGLEVSDRLIIDEDTGSEAFWLVNGDGARVKRLLEAVEDSFPAARLFDFDVLIGEPCIDGTEQSRAAWNIRKLSREGSRRCLICGRPAAECARSRAHGLDAVKAATRDLLRGFCADTLAQAAYDALLSELYTTPKPGLVDLNNNGAHSDMDVRLFEKSAAALVPYLRDAAMLGMDGCGIAALRERGVSAEREMFAATGGINTHKGIIYSMGLLLAGAGRALARPSDIDRIPAHSSEVLQISETHIDPEKRHDSIPKTKSGADLCRLSVQYASGLAREDADEQLKKSALSPSTNGGAVYRATGAKGATGHAAAGFPDAVYCAERLLSYTNITGGTETVDYRSDTKDDPPGRIIFNIPGALALCDSMARLDDTNLLHRGGREGLKFVQSEASRISEINNDHELTLDGTIAWTDRRVAAAYTWIDERAAALEELDAEMIKRNLSPGGSADMLALAYFLLYLMRLNV